MIRNAPGYFIILKSGLTITPPLPPTTAAPATKQPIDTNAGVSASVLDYTNPGCQQYLTDQGRSRKSTSNRQVTGSFFFPTLFAHCDRDRVFDHTERISNILATYQRWPYTGASGVWRSYPTLYSVSLDVTCFDGSYHLRSSPHRNRGRPGCQKAVPESHGDLPVDSSSNLKETWFWCGLRWIRIIKSPTAAPRYASAKISESGKKLNYLSVSGNPAQSSTMAIHQCPRR